MTNASDKQSLITQIRESDGKHVNASPLASLIRKYLECPDSQQASTAFARALSLQGSGDPVYPQSGTRASTIGPGMPTILRIGRSSNHFALAK